MPELTKQIAETQAEYNRMEQEGKDKFGPKARTLLEKSIREEMKKQFRQLDVDVDTFKRAKGDLARKLHAMKQERRGEIIAEMALVPKDDVDARADVEARARAEFAAMGWSAEEINRDVRTGLTETRRMPSVIGPDPASAAPEPAPVEVAVEEQPVVEKIIDPITADIPQTRDVEYREGTAKEPPAETIEDPLTTERRRKNQPLRKSR